MNKRGFQISFAWLFGIIVGIFILALAAYMTTRVLNLGQHEVGAETQKRLGILLNPLETGFEESRIATISLPTETRIHNRCDEEGNFGRQVIQISQKSFGVWSEPAMGTYFRNRYILSKRINEGKNFYIFTKPFNFPFKVADLTYITSFSENYCFINSPSRIEGEISSMNQLNIGFAKSLNIDEIQDKCHPNSIKVCFEGGSGECDINVYEDSGMVEKKNEIDSSNTEEVYFVGDSLMYGAIFSDKETYECQLYRLMKRVKELSVIYLEKSSIVSKQNCNSNVDEELDKIISYISNDFSNSKDLSVLYSIIKEAEDRNDFAICRLW